MGDLVVVRAEEKHNKLVPPETKTLAGWAAQGGCTRQPTTLSVSKGIGVRWFSFKKTCHSFLGQQHRTISS